MIVKVAAQTSSASVASAIDSLCDEVNMPKFERNKEISDFIKKIDILFDLLNSINPFTKGIMQPVTQEYLPLWDTQCDELVRYIFHWKMRREDTYKVLDIKQPSEDLHLAFIL